MSNHRAFCGFNRVLLALISLAVLLGAAATLIFPSQALAALGRLTPSLQAAAANPGNALSLLPGVAIAGLIGLIVFLFEIWPRRGPESLVVPIEDGHAEYPPALVASTLTEQVNALAGVQGARVEVQGRHKRVNALVRLWLNGGEEPPVVINQVANRVREKIRAMGFEPGTVRVSIQSTPLDVPAPMDRAA